MTRNTKPRRNKFWAHRYSRLLPICLTVLALPYSAIAQSDLSTSSFAHLATSGGWNTSFTLVNTGTADSSVQLEFFGDSGSPLPLPLSFPQTPGIPVGPATVLTRTVGAGASLVMDSAGQDTSSLLTGWARMQSSGKMDGFGIFRYPQFKWEALVPLETRSANTYFVAFDNTRSLGTGVAVSSVTMPAGDVALTVRDENGIPLTTGTVTLSPQGHASFVVNQKFPVTVGKRGTIQFDAPPGGRISVVGFRANGSALTTLPVFTSAVSAGGAVAHITYNGDFASSYYILNINSAPAEFTIRYYADDGTGMEVPMFLPQSGTFVQKDFLTRTLDVGAMLEIDLVSQPLLAPISGSAVVQTTSNVLGYEVFRWSSFGQEASVPIETRTASSYVLAFDNTNGLTTGVAASVISANPVSIPVTISDDKGNILQRSTIALQGHGHVSFLLSSNFPVTANGRGTVEFANPTGAQVAVIGLRAKADGTLTTIPTLAK